MTDTFWSKVDRRDRVQCWPWLGTVNPKGYGRYHDPATRRAVQAHRRAYEVVIGPVPDGLVLDHLCRVRSCVNPWHLEPVTNRENVLRGIGLTAQAARRTHCHRGHPFSGDNLFVRKNGDRMCRTCNKSYPPYRLAASTTEDEA